MESLLRVRWACRAAKAAQVDSRKSEADLYFSDRRFERNNDIWLAKGTPDYNFILTPSAA
jgi:hypothetical protein